MKSEKLSDGMSKLMDSKFKKLKFKFKKPKDDIDKVIQAFLKDETNKKFGRYFIENQKLFYKTVITDSLRLNSKNDRSNKADLRKLIKAVKKNYIVVCDFTLQELQEKLDNPHCVHSLKVRVLRSDLIAQKIKLNNNSFFLANSSVLSLIGRTVCFGHEKDNNEQTEIQARLSNLIPMLPFNVFHEAGLKLDDIEILERGPNEIVKRKEEYYDRKENKTKYRILETHYTGASLFKVNKKYFLFDIDRREIKHNVFNAFLVELPVMVSSIKAAYASLKPKEVRKAEMKGLKIKRQGEWFFIPIKHTQELKADKTPKHDRRWLPEFRPMTLQAGPNRPNKAQYGIQKKNYVKGKISHSGREHADLILKDWHLAIPNTAIKSFTITGDVD